MGGMPTSETLEEEKFHIHSTQQILVFISLSALCTSVVHMWSFSLTHLQTFIGGFFFFFFKDLKSTQRNHSLKSSNLEDVYYHLKPIKDRSKYKGLKKNKTELSLCSSAQIFNKYISSIVYTPDCFGLWQYNIEQNQTWSHLFYSSQSSEIYQI